MMVFRKMNLDNLFIWGVKETPFLTLFEINILKVINIYYIYYHNMITKNDLSENTP